MVSAWSNIEISERDEEILKIDEFGDSLGEIPEEVIKIRELITGFEICHFKYKKHIAIIRESIDNLHALKDLSHIGKTHMRHGENAWKNDFTGRSLKGQQYLWAMEEWLGTPGQDSGDKQSDRKITEQVRKWLGEKTREKELLVNLLIYRLTWNSLDDICSRDLSEMEYQIARMDICHYAFPEILEKQLESIGKLEPVKGFEGCGTFNEETKELIGRELRDILERLKTKIAGLELKPDDKEKTKIWLMACLAKTLKEQTGTKVSLPPL